MFSDAAQRASGHCSCGNVTISGLSLHHGQVQLRTGSIHVQRLNSVSCCEAGHQTFEIKCRKCGKSISVQFQRGLAFGALTPSRRRSLHDAHSFGSWSEYPPNLAQLICEDDARDEDACNLDQPLATTPNDSMFVGNEEEESSDYELMFSNKGQVFVGSFQSALMPELLA